MSEATMEADPIVMDVITDADPEAPFGRFKNGNPRKRPTGPNAPRAKKPSTSRKTKTDYRPGFLGLTQLAAFGVGFFSPLDAIAITDHSKNLAEAVQVTADNDPKFAAMMDRILQAGPYAALISASVPLLMQVLHNHDKVPGEVVKGMGGRTKQEIIEELSQAA